MSKTELPRHRTICSRKEPRYKAKQNAILHSNTSLKDGGSALGTVVDLSSTGLRLLSNGHFRAGQPFFTELTADRSYGIYEGVVRRVEPWAGGQSILGCSLKDPIPDSVLTDLALEGVIDRRADDRIELRHNAKLKWPLNPDEVDVTITDYSVGGMKIVSTVPIPQDVRLRIRLDLGYAEELVFEVKGMCQHGSGQDFVIGAAFSSRDAHEQVAQVFGLREHEESVCERSGPSRLRRGLAYAAGAAVFGYAVVVMANEIIRPTAITF